MTIFHVKILISEYNLLPQTFYDKLNQHLHKFRKNSLNTSMSSGTSHFPATVYTV